MKQLQVKNVVLAELKAYGDDVAALENAAAEYEREAQILATASPYGEGLEEAVLCRAVAQELQRAAVKAALEIPDE